MTLKPCMACGKQLNLPHSRKSCYEHLLGVRIPELRTELNEVYAQLEAESDVQYAQRSEIEAKDATIAALVTALEKAAKMLSLLQVMAYEEPVHDFLTHYVAMPGHDEEILLQDALREWNRRGSKAAEATIKEATNGT